MTIEERLAVVARAAQEVTDNTNDIELSTTRVPRRPNSTENGQLSFWTPEEIWAITGSSPSESRQNNRRTSSYATPPELALDVVAALPRYATDQYLDFGDPAAGNGILLAAVRRIFGLARLRSAQLIELDLAAARIAEQQWHRTGTEVVQADFLHLLPSAGDWSLVIANPPYRRSQLVSAETAHVRDSLQKSLDIQISARSDLYVYFLLRAHAWMKDDAVAAWIIPAEFQVTEYGAAVRTYLTSHVQLLRMHTFDSIDPVFDNALTSTSVVIFRKRRADASAMITLTEGGTLAEPRQEVQSSTARLRSSARWNFSVLRSQKPNSHAVTIGDLFEVRRGIATGSNKHFVIDDRMVIDLDIQAKWIKPILPAARMVEGSLIAADGKGNPIPSSGKWLIDTDETISAIEAESPKFASYLRYVEKVTAGRALVARRRNFSKQEDRPVAPFVFAYMVKSGSATPRFLRNLSNGTFLNNYIGLYFRTGNSTPVRSEGYLADLHDRLLRIEAEELRIHGRLYGKDLLKLEPGDLRRVEIPN